MSLFLLIYEKYINFAWFQTQPNLCSNLPCSLCCVRKKLLCRWFKFKMFERGAHPVDTRKKNEQAKIEHQVISLFRDIEKVERHWYTNGTNFLSSRLVQFNILKSFYRKCSIWSKYLIVQSIIDRLRNSIHKRIFFFFDLIAVHNVTGLGKLSPPCYVHEIYPNQPRKCGIWEKRIR